MIGDQKNLDSTFSERPISARQTCQDCAEKESPKYCNQQNCIQGGSSEIIHEINMRLVGFGAIPHDKWDDRTTDAVKKFQKYFMKMTNPTGRICNSTINGLDQFSSRYAPDIAKLKCPCVKKTGEISDIETEYLANEAGINRIQRENDEARTEEKAAISGLLKKSLSSASVFDALGNSFSTSSYVTMPEPDEDESMTEEFLTSLKIDYYGNICCEGFGRRLGSNESKEHEGMHRGLFWILKALDFFLKDPEVRQETGLNYSIKGITSAYRCESDNRRHPYNQRNSAIGNNQPVSIENNKVKFRASKNHRGMAIDIVFEDNDSEYEPSEDENQTIHSNVRKKIMMKYMNAKINWAAPDCIGLEPGNEDTGSFKARTWVHFDMREFKSCLDDRYFIKTNEEVIKTISGEDSLTAMIKKANHPILDCNEYLNKEVYA